MDDLIERLRRDDTAMSVAAADRIAAADRLADAVDSKLTLVVNSPYGSDIPSKWIVRIADIPEIAEAYTAYTATIAAHLVKLAEMRKKESKG